jgi:preprotein translocase subunit SecD
LIALVLFVVWTNIFKWFGLMMMLNAVMIIFINVPVTKYLMQMFLSDKKN